MALKPLGPLSISYLKQSDFQIYLFAHTSHTSLFKGYLWAGIMAHAINAGTEEAEAGGSLRVPAQPELLSEIFPPAKYQ